MHGRLAIVRPNFMVVSITSLCKCLAYILDDVYLPSSVTADYNLATMDDILLSEFLFYLCNNP